MRNAVRRNETNKVWGDCKATLRATCCTFDVFVWHACLYKFNMSGEILARTEYGWVYIFLGSDVVVCVTYRNTHKHTRSRLYSLHKKKIVLALALSCLNYINYKVAERKKKYGRVYVCERKRENARARVCTWKMRYHIFIESIFTACIIRHYAILDMAGVSIFRCIFIALCIFRQI